jgi:hypothetical protein
VGSSAHRPAQAEAAAVGQPGVQDGDVGTEVEDLGQGDQGEAGLAHDLDVVLGFEQAGQPAADNVVLRSEVHPDRFVPSHGPTLPSTGTPHRVNAEIARPAGQVLPVRRAQARPI